MSIFRVSYEDKPIMIFPDIIKVKAGLQNVIYSVITENMKTNQLTKMKIIVYYLI